MQAIPVIHCSSVERSLKFYVDVLGFEKMYGAADTDWVIFVQRDGALLQLSQHAGDGAFGCVTLIRGVKDVDALWREFRGRGLDARHKQDSPVHQGPVDQTWGVREFCVEDPDGNRLCFGQAIAA